MVYSEEEYKRLTTQYNAVVEQNKQLQKELNEIKKDIEVGIFCITCKKENENDKLRVGYEKYKKCINDVKELAKIALEDDDKPACVYDDDCPLNNGIGFDNHCTLNCPYIISKKIVDKIIEVENDRL